MYSPEIVSNFSNPTHNGDLDGADQIVETKDPVCGDQVKIWLSITDGRVSTARFQAWGCATSVATANILCAWMENRLVDDIVASESDELQSLLGTIAPEQTHCVKIMQSLISGIDKGGLS